ncbi:MAG: extracellular solute-binding protein [Clostridiaceae bacterium]|nr:extracellular solute-binding protein [Clostridiaceae bacterium]
MKRFVYSIITVLMILCIFTSCSVNHRSTLPIPDSMKNVTFSEHMDISIGFWNIHDMSNNKDRDAILKEIENTFNITIHPVSVSWENYKERYQIMSSTKSLPDIFATVTISSTSANDSARLLTLIENHDIRALPNDLSKFPRLREIFGNMDYIRAADGNFYVIPRIAFKDPLLSFSDVGMVVRKDWMETLGMDAPENLEEFIELVGAFANKDPDRNGLHDTIGYNVNNRAALGKWLILGIAPQCNIYSWIKTEQGFIPSYLTEDFKLVVQAYRRLYETGGLDPDFYTKKATDAVDDFARGKLGALEYKVSPSAIMELESVWRLHQDKPFEECVGLLEIFPAPDGKRYRNVSNVFWSETLISSNVDDNKMERILYLFDYLLSEEGYALIRYGLEGVDYIIQDGKYHCLLEDISEGSLVKTLENKYPSLTLFPSLASWGGDRTDFEPNEINYLRYGKYATDISYQSLLWNEENTIPVERNFDCLLMPKEPSDMFSTQAVLDDLTRIIIGKGDPIQMWESQLERYYQEGIADYIQRHNEAYLKNKYSR